MRHARWAVGALVLLGIALAPLPKQAKDMIAGPVEAEVVRVIDGDTVVVRAHIWLGQRLETAVRVLGVDTPEPRGKCPEEKALAERATRFVEQRLAAGPVMLREISLGKFAGRVTARVETPDGDLSSALIDAGLARAYEGGRREPWC